jgi:GT2 family glycosyltransferase
MLATPPLVSIITVNFNQTEMTCALLQSIRAQEFRNLEIIVVDNGSTQHPGATIQARFPEVLFLRSETNLGFAGGNNIGIGAARGQYLFFVNNDTEIPPHCIQQLVDFLQTNPQCGAVSPLLYYFTPADPPLIQYAGMTQVSDITARNTTVGARCTDTGQFTQPSPTAYAHGAAMMIPARVVQEAGAMYPAFFLYYEELDWCERIRAAGYEIWVQPLAKMYHKEGHTVGTNSPLKTYFIHRNRMLFMARNRRSALWVFYCYIWLVVFPKNSIVFILKKDWRNAQALLQAMLWYFGGVPNPYERLVPAK